MKRRENTIKGQFKVNAYERYFYGLSRKETTWVFLLKKN